MNNDPPQQTFIHINWKGPHKLKDVILLNGSQDYGVYQIYGAHPVYGSGSLLYIGLAADQTFAARLAQEMGEWQNNSDAERVEIYVGRLWGPKTPDNQSWCRQIALAERLLIYVHQPAQNAQKELAAMTEDIRDVHVINWHCYRDLLPEVSGACWAGRYPDFATWNNFNSEECHARQVSAPVFGK